MGFQDNSGDIIFDVVLTDEGRLRLAKGDGEFNITHFKCADDEINYGLFDKNAQSAYQDLQILQTPVFEAFTNNTSNMSSLLVSYAAQDLLYLPVLKLNQLNPPAGGGGNLNSAMHASGTFMVCVDSNTAGYDQSNQTTGVGVSDANKTHIPGMMYPSETNQVQKGTTIYIEAGYDTTAVPVGSNPADVIDMGSENEYVIEMDGRLGHLSWNGVKLNPDFTDDDFIDTYSIDNVNEPDFVVPNFEPLSIGGEHVIAGYRFMSLNFNIEPSSHLRNSDFYFQKFGGVTSMHQMNGSLGTNNVRFIDTLIKVTNLDTGYSLEIPIRYIKLV